MAKSTAWDSEGTKLGEWLAELAATEDQDALLQLARAHTLSHYNLKDREEAAVRSWQQAVGDGMAALDRARRLLDVHKKSVPMDGLRIALAVICERCGGRRDGEMRMWRGDVVCARCHDEATAWERGEQLPPIPEEPT